MGLKVIPMKNIIIAVDGYSSCGKSTLAKQLARKLNMVYVDSGAMYRAITLHLLNNQINLNDSIAITASIEMAKIEFRTLYDKNIVLLNGKDVSAEIRQLTVSERVSKVSPILTVRNALVAQQREMGQNQSVIMDGRDIGTAVFPNATIKLFMTAAPQRRAERRHKELLEHGQCVTYEQVYENLKQRDYDDTHRTESPLLRATDAIIIDNTDLGMQDQYHLVLEIIESKCPELLSLSKETGALTEI